MSQLRWKAQSLQLHNFNSGPDSKAAKQGILPVYAHLAFIIASSAAAIAGMAKRAWRDDDKRAMSIVRVRSLRKLINDTFDQLEAAIDKGIDRNISAIPLEKIEQATVTHEKYGNFAMLALTGMEEAAELAIPLMQVADGSKTLSEAKAAIDFESADVRVNLHIISEKARVCPETSTAAKWMLIRERAPAEAFEIIQRTLDAETFNRQLKHLKPS